MAVVTIERKTSQSRSLKKTGLKFAGRTAIGLAILSGPAIGMTMGWRNARADHGRLLASEAERSHISAQVSADKLAVQNFLDQQPPACASAIRQYLPGGPNDSFSSGEAQISLQNSRLCSPSDIALVGTVRELNQTVITDAQNLEAADRNVAGKQHDAAHNYELFQGALLGVPAEIGVAVVGFFMYIVALDEM